MVLIHDILVPVVPPNNRREFIGHRQSHIVLSNERIEHDLYKDETAMLLDEF
jgi:hypothetical protein